MAVTIQTAVFQRIMLEKEKASYQAGFSDGYKSSKEVGIRGMVEMMGEANRWGTFSKPYLAECAKRLWDYFARNPNATNTNQVL